MMAFRKCLKPTLAAAALALTALCLTPKSQAGLLAFDGGGIGMFSAGGGYSLTGFAAWSPGFGITDSIDFRSRLGANFPKSTAGGVFVGIDASIFASYRLSDLYAVGVGPGMQLWIDNGGAYLQAAADFVWTPKEKLLGIFNRAFVGYEFVTVANTHNAQLGVGVNL